MTIILEREPLPSTGHLHLNVTIDANIVVSAEEAQKVVSRRMFADVSYLAWAEQPSLVVGNQTVWRVPVYIGLVGVGRIGPIAIVDVHVETGEMQEITPQFIAEMKERTRITVLMSLQSKSKRQFLNANDLQRSGLIGLWKHRTDIKDSSDYARQLREQAQHRK
jgi:hypothetical protein